KREEIELHNQAEGLIYTVEKTLHDSSAKLTEATKNKVETALKNMKDALESHVAADLRRKMDALQTASHAMAQELYQKSSSQPGDASGPSASGTASDRKPGDDNVVDADYKVVDDDNK
ncbi:MAG: Hsp70 family protein, partial [Atribacterota bacterium]